MSSRPSVTLIPKYPSFACGKAIRCNLWHEKIILIDIGRPVLDHFSCFPEVCLSRPGSTPSAHSSTMGVIVMYSRDLCLP